MKVLTLFLLFLKISTFTFGGGYAMIPLINYELTKHGYIESDELYSFIGISESTPGAFAINIATFIGFEQYGILGAVLLNFAIVLPSFLIILYISSSKLLHRNTYIKRAISFLKPAAIAFIFTAALKMSFKVFFDVNNLFGLRFNTNFFTIFVFMLVLLISLACQGLGNNKRPLHPVLIILFSGLSGLVLTVLNLNWNFFKIANF